MMKKNKWAHRRQIFLANAPVNHNSSLGEYHKWLASPPLVNNLSKSPAYEVYCESKTFGIIKLKKISYEWITSQEVTAFFRSFDFVDKVSIYTNRPFYIDDDSVISFTLLQKKYEMPVHLFWECLPQEVRNNFKLWKDHYKNIKALLAAYERRIRK